MTVTTFYNELRHLGNVFGQRGPFYGPLGHRGVDFNGHAAGTAIPSWTAGVVAEVTNFRTLGWTVIIRRPDGQFAGFCHMLERPLVRVGQTVTVGSTLGKVGSTGILSSGPHLHTTLEPTIKIGTANARDPLPLIRKAVADYALTGGGTPIEPEEEEDVIAFIKVKGQDAVRVVGGGYRYQFATQAELDSFRAILTSSGHKVPPVVEVPTSFSSNLMWRAADTSPAGAGGTVDLKPVLDAVAGVPTKTVDQIKDRL
jgi:hypothetical protein